MSRSISGSPKPHRNKNPYALGKPGVLAVLPLPGSSAEEVCGLPGSLISALAKEDIHRLLRSLWGKQLGTAGVFAAGALGIASPLWMFGTILLAAFTFQRRDTVYADCCNAENQMRLPPGSVLHPLHQAIEGVDTGRFFAFIEGYSMYKGKAYQLVFRYAIPQMVGLLFNSVYTIVDETFIGNRLGREALWTCHSIAEMLTACCAVKDVGWQHTQPPPLPFEQPL